MPKNEIISLLAILSAFTIIVAASSNLSSIFQKIKLPAITGFIIVGVLAGPYLLKMLPGDLTKLEFINDISLAFIAFAAGAEIYFKEIRDKIRDISIMTASQFFLTFIVSFFAVMLLADLIPFMKGHSQNEKIAVSLLISTIFIARSPASAIAIINELRAKGPFTKISLGVTILKDIFVIVLFALTFSIADVLIKGNNFNIIELLFVFLSLFISIGLGVIYAKSFVFLFKRGKNEVWDGIILLLLGWSMFGLSKLVAHYSHEYIHYKIHIEALLVGIVSAFYITNFTTYRLYLAKIVEKLSPYVYAAFFTLIGATISLDILVKYWTIAILFVIIRLLAIFIASVVGSIILKQTAKEIFLSWTPYVTQAGVSLGLITIVASNFVNLGSEFESILITVIIINQFIGPPLMKFAIISMGEAHTKGDGYEYDFHKDVFIFGVGGKAIMLAQTLQKQGADVKIITDKQNVKTDTCSKVPIHIVQNIDYQTLENLNFKTADSVVIFRKNKPALEIAELIYEKFGTPNVIAVVEKHDYIKQLRELGTIVVAPTGALITLLADFVRSPKATQILLGMQESHETSDIEVLARDMHGRALRDIDLPLGLLILSITRHHDVIVPHGYTRLRLHDIVTVVGSPSQIEILRTKLQINE